MNRDYHATGNLLCLNLNETERDREVRDVMTNECYASVIPPRERLWKDPFNHPDYPELKEDPLTFYPDYPDYPDVPQKRLHLSFPWFKPYRERRK